MTTPDALQCWETIGDELVVESDLGIEIKQITHRMAIPVGWRIMVTHLWRDTRNGGGIRKEVTTFNAMDALHKWTLEKWREAMEAGYGVPDDIKQKLTTEENQQ